MFTDIENKISPFAHVKGEVKRLDGFQGEVAISQVLNKIERGHMNEIIYKVLSYLAKYEFLTSRQINQLLTLDGMGLDTSKKLVRKMDQILRDKLITRYCFSRFEETSSYRVYALDKNGKYLLEAKGIYTDWKPADNFKSPEVVKGRLAINQFLIAVAEKVGSYESSDAKKEIISPRVNAKPETAGIIYLRKENKKVPILTEAVRRGDNWKKQFVKSFKVYKDFFEEFKRNNNYNIEPHFILVCEDFEHMKEVYNQIIENDLEFDKKIFFTYDLLQIEKDLSKSWFEFIKTEKGMQVKSIDINLLKPIELQQVIVMNKEDIFSDSETLKDGYMKRIYYKIFGNPKYKSVS